MYYTLGILLVVIVSSLAQDAVIYDAYFGKPVTERRSEFLSGNTNATSFCLIPVRPCRHDEGRRVDGTCTNPMHPSRGASLTPLPRLLPPMFGPGNTLRSAKDGFELPSARLIRTMLIGDGYFREHHFSVLATHIHVTATTDTVDLLYLLRYVAVSDCCLLNTPNRVDPMCIAIPVPNDDPYLRRTPIRCLPLARVITYQDYMGAFREPSQQKDTYFQISTVTPLLDLSLVYGNTEARNREIRANQSGLLAFRMEWNREVPEGNGVFCALSPPPGPICYNYGDNFQGNLLPGIFMTTMWFFREHNRIARALAKINSCWDDEKLFQTARQINIAQYQYIVFYELLAQLLGPKNALAEGIIYDTDGYVNDFDRNYEPGVLREYVVATRWFHTYQPGDTELYRNDTYVGSRPIPEDIFRSGILAINNTEADITQGSIIQPAHQFDYVMDPQLAERTAGERQPADLPAIDFMRGRDAGFPPYNHYREFCGMKPARHWEDLYDTIDKDKVEILKRLYGDVEDMELMVAIYVEKLLPGAYVGPTLYCIMVRNLLLFRRSDQFFFEHGDHPRSLTIAQLNEIRQTSIARILCDNGDGISYIQPAAFFRRSEWNHPVHCSEIPWVNLDKWQNHTCQLNPTKQKQDNLPIQGLPTLT